MEKRKGRKKIKRGGTDKYLNRWMEGWWMVDGGWIDGGVDEFLYPLDTEIQPVLSRSFCFDHFRSCPPPSPYTVSCFLLTLWAIPEPAHLDWITAGVHARPFHRCGLGLYPYFYVPTLLRKHRPGARTLARGCPVVWLCTALSSALTPESKWVSLSHLPGQQVPQTDLATITSLLEYRTPSSIQPNLPKPYFSSFFFGEFLSHDVLSA